MRPSYLEMNLPAATKAMGAKRKARIMDGLWSEGTKQKKDWKMLEKRDLRYDRPRGHPLYAHH
jgi:hypothetical protein